MKGKLPSPYILLILLLVFAAGCIEQQEVKTTTFEEEIIDENRFVELMEEANTAYVNALVSTSQKNISASRSAISTLVEKLNYASDNYGEAPPEIYSNDRNWNTEIKRAVLIAEYSQEMLDEGDIEASHKALEPIRDLFFGLHERNNVLHMGDYMTVFHASMEEAIDAANANDTETVITYIPRLKNEWQEVKHAERATNVDEGYEQSLVVVEAAIEVLDSSAATGNTTQIKQDSESLRLAFSKFFVKYGVVIS